MNEDDIKRLTKPYWLPEPHNTVLNAALTTLVNSPGDCTIKITKKRRPDGLFAFMIDVDKPQ